MDMVVEPTATSAPTPPKPTVRHTVARLVSAIIHPIAYPLVTLGIITLFAGSTPLDAGKWVLLALVLTTVPIAALVGFQVLRGAWTDLDVSVRKQRYTLYPFGLVCMLALAVVFARLNAPRIAVQAAIAITATNFVNGLINFAYKVSAHAAGAAICAALLCVGASTGWGVAGVAAALAVGWSRVELGRHTPGQVLLGWTVGAASVLTVHQVF